MLTLYQHPFASYCWKALIALDELDLPYEKVQIDTDADRMRLSELWPMANMPVLTDDSSGTTMPEATAIIEYLDQRAGGGQLIPADPAHALDVRLWDRIFDNYVMTPMQKIVLDSLRPEGEHDTFGVEEARRELELAYAMLDARLPESGWAGGDAFTLADCSGAPALFYARVVHNWDDTDHPSLARYYADLRARPSVDRVIDDARFFREHFPLGWPEDVD